MLSEINVSEKGRTGDSNIIGRKIILESSKYILSCLPRILLYAFIVVHQVSSSNLGHLSFSHADTATSMETRQEIIPRFLFFAQDDSHLEKKRG